MEAHYHVHHSDTEDEEETKRDEPQNEGTDFETAVSLTGFGKFNYFLLLICLVGTIGHQCDITSLSFLLPSAECDLQLSPMDKGYLTAVMFVGSMFGSFLWGFLSDAFGRHVLLLVIYLLDSIVNIIASFSQTFWMLLVFKFLAGFLICGPQAMTKAYLSEFHDEKHRARLVLWTGLYASSGNLLVPAVAWAVIPQPWSWKIFDLITYNSWRVYMLIVTLPTLIACILLFFSCETPKFLMAAGKDDQALQVLRKMYSVNTGKDPDTYPVKFLTTRKISRVLAPDLSHKSVFSVIRRGFCRMKPLFKTPLLPRALLIFTLNFGAIYGVNTLKQWLPQLFATIEEYDHLQVELNITSSRGVSLCEMVDFVAAQDDTAQLRQSGTGHCSVVPGDWKHLRFPTT
ncbi:synaptic vesicle glycoprotein 2C-like isoform X2 [Bacillus rossius redtenbacheri]|uniref:synaptic vesicle glycoprotein 2C-like isoform X2 n=1 Tax=Bacillus rossius redtenbacheri TaxID=93214 RepID=UPI002FDD737A